MSTKPPRAPEAAKPKRSPFLLRLVGFVLVVLLVLAAALFIPPVFRTAFRGIVMAAAWRSGAELQIDRIEGSITSPVRLVGARWTLRSSGGAVTRFEAARAEAEFSWRHLLDKDDDQRWFRRLRVEDVTGKIELPAEPADWTLASKRKTERLLLIPAQFEAANVRFALQAGEMYMKVEECDLTAGKWKPGALAIKTLSVHHPLISRKFRDIRGATSVTDRKLQLAGVRLDPELTLTSFSLVIDKLLRGQIDLVGDAAAFGGTMRMQAATLVERSRPRLDATVDFSQIGIAPLAAFLGRSEAAGGTIKDGNLRFRGSLRKPESSTASLRLEATHFQWESRQWDALALGATLLDGRISVPQLELRQGENSVSLRGDAGYPATRTAWWKTEFNLNVTARLANLTNFSALVLPEFRFAKGRINIDGAVSGRNEQFHGAVLVEGRDLVWRDAPVQDLHAAIKLSGNEVHLANLQLLNDRDVVRGRGVINIFGPKQYWGEWRAEVDDLRKYAALLQKPILPEPLAGGAEITWSGEGSAKGHSGSFSARLKQLRSLGATGAMLHPVDADVEGVYSPAGAQFSRFKVWDETLAFNARVSAEPKSLRFEEIRLGHGEESWLTGSATLPLDLWQNWPNVSLAKLLIDESPLRLDLKASGLQLQQAARLSGWRWPIEGRVDGTIQAHGTTAAMKSAGELMLRGGQFAFDREGKVTDVEAHLAFQNAAVRVNRYTGQVQKALWQGAGEIRFASWCDPTLDITAQSTSAPLTFFAPAWPLNLRSDLNLRVTGPWHAALIEGRVVLHRPREEMLHSLAPLFQNTSLSHWSLPFSWSQAPFRNWRWKVEAASGRDAQPTMLLTGDGHRPILSGDLDLLQWAEDRDPAPVSFSSSPRSLLPALRAPWALAKAVVTFREAAPEAPSIELIAEPAGGGGTCQFVILGPITGYLRLVSGGLAIDPATLAAHITQPPSLYTEVSFASLVNGWDELMPVYEWHIADPEVTAPVGPPPEAPVLSLAPEE